MGQENGQAKPRWMFCVFGMFRVLGCLRDIGRFHTSTRLGIGIDDTHLFGMGTREIWSLE